MNIVMFTNTYAPMIGGIERSIATFTEDFRHLGHRTLVVTPEFAGAEESDELVCRLPAVKNFYGSEFSVKLPFPPALSDRLEEFSPDIVHSHQPFMLGDTALRKARSAGLPLIFTHHTLYERYTQGLKLEMEGLERAAKAISVAYANCCDLVIAPTQSIADIIRQRGATVPIEVVPTGIEIDYFKGGDGAAFRERNGIGQDEFVVGHLGRLIPAKNISYLAEATARFVQQFPNTRALFTGEGESVQDIERTFRKAGLESRLTLLDALPHNQVAEVYAAMDCFAFASHSDTQGIVIIEAMAAGTPVVALNATGPKDIVEHEQSGLLVPEHAALDEFITALSRLYQDAALRDRLTSGARQRATEFDRIHCAKRMLDVYQRAIDNGPAQHERDVFETLEKRLQAEWLLIQEKAELIKAFLPNWGDPKV